MTNREVEAQGYSIFNTACVQCRQLAPADGSRRKTEHSTHKRRAIRKVGLDNDRLQANKLYANFRAVRQFFTIADASCSAVYTEKTLPAIVISVFSGCRIVKVLV